MSSPVLTRICRPAPPICGGGFDEAKLNREIAELEASAASPDFWKDQEAAQKALQRRRKLDADRTLFETLKRQTDDLAVLIDWGRGGEDVNGELSQGLTAYEEAIRSAEIRTMLSGELDRKNAIITIHPGAGGTESQDWAQMILRMYLRWIERRGFGREVVDMQPGDEAGIKSATVLVTGDYAYGLLAAEAGLAAQGEAELDHRAYLRSVPRRPCRAAIAAETSSAITKRPRVRDEPRRRALGAG